MITDELLEAWKRFILKNDESHSSLVCHMSCVNVKMCHDQPILYKSHDDVS